MTRAMGDCSRLAWNLFTTAPSVSSRFLWFTPSTQVLSSAITGTTLVLQLVHSPSFVPSVSPPFASLTFAQAESTLLCVPLLLSLESVEYSAKFYSPYTPPIPTQTTTNTGKRCSGLALTHRLFREPTSENNDYSITLISTTPVYNQWLGVISLNE